MSARAPACAHSLVSEVVFSHKTHRIAITASFARPGRSGDVGAVPTLLPHQRHQRRQHARGRSLLGQRTAQQQLPEQPSRRRSSGISAKASNEPASGNAVPPLPPPGVTCVQAGLDSVECFIAPVQDSVGAKGGEGTVKKREKLDSRGTNTGHSTTRSAEVDASTAVGPAARSSQPTGPSSPGLGSSSAGLDSLLGLGLLVLPFALWGTAMVSTKLVLPDTSPLFVAVTRLLVAGVILCGVAGSRRAALPRDAGAWAAVALFGLVDGTMFQAFRASGLQHTSAGLSSIIIDTQPLTVAVFAALFLDEPITRTATLGLAVGVLGLSVGLLPPAVFSSGNLLQGLLSVADTGWGSGETMLLLAAQSMAVGTVLARWVCKDMGVEPTMATGLHLIIGALPLLAASVALEPELYARIAADGLPLTDIGLLAYTSIFGGAVAYGIFFHTASKGNLVTLSSLTFLTPLFAVLSGFFALGETLTPSQCAGGAVALAGVTLVVVGKATPGGGKGDGNAAGSRGDSAGSRRSSAGGRGVFSAETKNRLVGGGKTTGGQQLVPVRVDEGSDERKRRRGMPPAATARRSSS